MHATPDAQAACVIDRCVALGRFSETADGITRTFLSPPMKDVHRVLCEWMSGLGMETAVDAIGNLHGVYRGGNSNRRLIIGSHLDTVPNAGAYDGILGVVLGIALVEALRGSRLGYDIEVIGFSEEEGVRFGVPFLGSRAFVGDFSEDLMQASGKDGISIREAICAFGLNPGEIPAAKFQMKPIGYLEFHIEQGPVLESLNLPLGIVEAIAGQSRYSLRFEGQANHAGTTPMASRRDALAGAAEWISEVERVGCQTPGLVATVGRLNVMPGAGNVVPGAVEVSLDVRHVQDAVRHAAVRSLLEAAEGLADRRHLQLSTELLLDQSAIPCDPRLTEVLRRSLAAAGPREHTMVSGAGHDAMIIAPHMPTAMLFLRSPGGISHHPSESVLVGDVAAALETGLCFLHELEKEI